MCETPVLVEHEPFHQVIDEADGIRVIEAILPVGTVTRLHTHTLENVAITIDPGFLWAQDEGDSKRDFVSPVGRAVFKRAPYTHWVGNRGTTPVRMLHIDCPAARDESVNGTARPGAAELDNDCVRIARLTASAGSLIEPHAHGIAASLVLVSGRARVDDRELSPGHYICRRDGRMPTLHAVTAIEVVEIAWKRLPVG